MKSNSTGKPVEFYKVGKEMFDRIKPLTPNKPIEDEADALTITYMAGLRDGKKTNKREWVGLTLEDMQDLNVSKDWIDGARWAATLLWEKNNAKT